MVNKKSPPLIILTGPTAVGKTEISIKYAKAINGEIISADSIQVYKYMDIGSAKITTNEMQGVPHHLVDILNPDEEFNIYLFKRFAQQAISDIYSRGKIPIITGGTGFYIQSILYDIDFNETKDDDNSIRQHFEEIYTNKGASYLHSLLEKVDFQSAQAIHENNVKRVIRALEYYEQTGQKISLHNEEQSSHTSPYNFIYFVLNRNREYLYNRINERVDKMIDDGLVDEVKKLLDMGYNRNCVSMQGIGYKEIVSYINNECSLDYAIEKIKQDTRHFAKRQLTWFRREKDVTMLNYEDYDNSQQCLCDKMIELTKNKKII